MTKIDEGTGLVAVPDDMFWRVTEDKLWNGHSVKNVGGVRVDLMRKTVEEFPATEEERWADNGFFKHLFTGAPRSKKLVTVPARTETSEGSVAHRLLVKIEDKRPNDGNDWTEFTMYSHWGSSGDEQKFYRVIPATAENLLDSSIRVWEHYIKLQHEDALEENRKRELDKVLGDYPPKSIKDLVNA